MNGSRDVPGTSARPRTGLTPAEAASRLARLGPNRLFTPEPVRIWSIAAEEIREPMILLLIAIGLLYAFWGSVRDAVTIFVVILLLVAAEVINEFRAKSAIAALERLSAPQARVRRGGTTLMVDTETVVAGDILVLVPGERIPADAVVATATGLAVDESVLTGESLPVEKSAGDSVSAGTVVLSGEGEAEATATGAATRLGRVAGQLAAVKPPRTPLQLAMGELARKLVWVALFFSIAIPLIGIARGGDVRTMILSGLSLAFAVIPEELPIIVTMVLGVGAYRLSKQNFLVKRLQAAETLGDATVILTDKTGTLTEGRMQIVDAWPAGSERKIVEAALRTVSAEAPDALEQTVVARAHDLGIVAPPEGQVQRLRHPGTGRRSKSVLWRCADGSLRIHVTGAPEEVLARCTHAPADALEQAAAQARLGRRVVATAFARIDAQRAGAPLEELERDLEFAGLLAFADPPRQGMRQALAQVSAAGIRTIMVTGDHPATAAAIAAEVGIASKRTLTGDEIDRMDDAQLAMALADTSVFARATPEHKYRLVLASQKAGEVVVVTGDGVNDALALKAANVGVAMGLKGTDVAKEAAQAVLADDNYATLARAVFEGRHFYDNLRKGISYYLAVKAALIAIFLLPAVAGLPLPFSPVQIILLEMFMDLAASMGFVAEPAEGDVTRRPPRNPKRPLLDGAAVRDVFLRAGLLLVAVSAAYAWAYHRGLPTASMQSCAFAAWMVAHVALALFSRSDHEPLMHPGAERNRVMEMWALAAIAFTLAALYVGPVREALRFGAVPPADLLVSVVVAVACVFPAELRKYVRPFPRRSPA